MAAINICRLAPRYLIRPRMENRAAMNASKKSLQW
jgi:hypothetical protein